MDTMQRADPKARRKAMGVICVATVLGLAAILTFRYMRDDVQAWLEQHLHILLEHPLLVFVASLILVSPLFAAGIYLYLVGKRTVRAQRFPPPGYAVARDTLVLTGGQAIRRGWLLQLLSLILVGGTGAIPVIMWYLFRSLGSTP
jgi:hypothetical protein